MSIELGVVKWFSIAQGHGFINRFNELTREVDASEDIFVHYSSILGEEDFKILRQGELVQLVIADGPKGLVAHDVKKYVT